MKRSGPHFHVIGLMNDTAPVGPKMMEREDEILKRHGPSKPLVGHMKRAKRLKPSNDGGMLSRERAHAEA